MLLQYRLGHLRVEYLFRLLGASRVIRAPHFLQYTIPESGFCREEAAGSVFFRLKRRILDESIKSSSLIIASCFPGATRWLGS